MLVTGYENSFLKINIHWEGLTYQMDMRNYFFLMIWSFGKGSSSRLCVHKLEGWGEN